MNIKIVDLKKHEYNKEVFIDLDGEEFENLVNSISQTGLLTPIIIDENYTILCGHQRVRAFKVLKITEIDATIKRGLSELEKKEIIIADNLNRRQLTEFQEIECYKRLKEIETEKAKERKKETQLAGKDKSGNTLGGGKTSTTETGKARDKSAEKINKKTKKKTTGKTYDAKVKKEDKIRKESPELFEKFKKGIITLNQAIKILSDKEIEKNKKEQQKEIEKSKKKIDYQLIHGDLFNEIKNINKQFSLIYCDPPYNILDEEWDNFSEKEFKDFTLKWLDVVLPKLKDDGRIYINFSQRFMFDLYEWMKDYCKKYDLVLGNVIIWHYRNNMKPTNDRKQYKYSYEPIFYYRKKNSPILSELPEYGEEKFDVWTIATPQSNYNEDKKEHPSQKPKELLRRIILTGSNINDWIFDPFAGIGTSGIVAKECGRNFVLIEKDKDYFKKLRTKIEDGEQT